MPVAGLSGLQITGPKRVKVFKSASEYSNLSLEASTPSAGLGQALKGVAALFLAAVGVLRHGFASQLAFCDFSDAL